MRYIIPFLFLAIMAQAQTSYDVERIPGDTSAVWFLQIDSTAGPDSTGIGTEVNIRKLLVTKVQLQQILFSIADQQKQIIDRQAAAEQGFSNSKQLLKQQTGEDYNDLLARAALQTITDKWKMQYQGKTFDAEIKDGALVIDKNSYPVQVVDRNEFTFVGLMGQGKDVTVKVVGNGATMYGDYNKKRIVFTRG